MTMKVKAGKKARRALKRKAPKSLRIAISVALGGLEYKSATVRFSLRDRPAAPPGRRRRCPRRPSVPSDWCFLRARWGPHEIRIECGRPYDTQSRGRSPW